MEKSREQIYKERNTPIYIPPAEIDITDSRRPDIEKYVPPKSINTKNAKKLYSTYSDNGDCPYSQGKNTEQYVGYKEKTGYTVQKCFKCSKNLTDCKCQIKSSKIN